MIRKKTVFFLLVLILGTVLPAAEAATPVQPLPDGKIVIVVKDYELLKNTAAPPTGMHPPETAQQAKGIPQASIPRNGGTASGRGERRSGSGSRTRRANCCSLSSESALRC